MFIYIKVSHNQITVIIHFFGPYSTPEWLAVGTDYVKFYRGFVKNLRDVGADRCGTFSK